MSSLIINHVVPAIRMFTSKQKLMVARFDDRSELLKAEDETDLLGLDYIKKSSGILVVDETKDPDEIIDDLTVKLSTWYETRTPHPDYILLKGIGLVAIAENAAALDILLGAQEQPVKEISGRVQDKIIIVTGGAQGFGGGIAELLYAQGANVVIADLNEETGSKMADALNANSQTNQAYFVKVNVGSAESVEAMVAATVKQFGGLDVIISNAGILRAGGLDEMTPESFALMTEINYGGYLKNTYSQAFVK